MQTLSRTIAKTNPRQGVTTVEFALVSPLLFLVIFGAIEFSQVNMIRNSADHAAYEAARAAVVPGANADAAAAKARVILDTVGVRQSTITVSPNPILNTTTQVDVSVRVPLNENLWIVPKFFQNTVVVRNCSLGRERYEN